MPRTRSTGQTTKTASRSATAAAEAAIVTSAPRPARGATPAVATGGAAPTRRSSSSAGGEAAVDGELGAGHVRRVVAGQEQRHAGDLARRRDAAERNARLELFAERIREVRRLERRVDDARVDDVAAHTVASELDGQRLRQRDQPALGRRLVDVGDDDARSFAGEEQAGLAPDAVAGPRDQRDLVRETVHIRSKLRMSSQSVTA